MELTFYKDKTTLNIQFYTPQIVRFSYNPSPDRGITDGVILKPREVDVHSQGNLIQSPLFDVKISDNLEVTILEKDGTPFLEDHSLQFGETEETLEKVHGGDNLDEAMSRQLYKRENALHLKKKILWERGFYALGEHFTSLNLKGTQLENWNTDILGVAPIHHEAQKAYHTSIPFYIGMDTKRAYGIYHDNSYHSYFDFGKHENTLSYKTEGGDLDYYFLFGPRVSDVVEQYGLLTGTTPLPRRDFLGYHQCRWSYKNHQEVIQVARNLRKHRIPSDVIYLDIDYMEDYKVFTLHSRHFSQFKQMTRELRYLGFKLVVIIDPGVKVQEGYHAYQQGLEGDYFLKNSQGEVYIGKVWPGDSAFPDFLREEVRTWWGELHSDLVDQGVEGIWNDMNEIADMSTDTKTVPEDCYHVDDGGAKYLQKEVHNLYGHYHSLATYEGLKKIQGTRPFVLTRAASAGSQRHTAIWSGDNSSVWAHLQGSLPILMNLGLSGFAYSGADIGGFLEDSTPELFTRWIQTGIFYPLCRNHSVINSRPQEPWAFDKETLEITRKFISLRYQLIDYLYNLFRENSLTGAPVLRPLLYHYQEDENTHNISDQFLWGRDLLVAPILHPGADHRMVYLPEGHWIDFFTHQEYTGGQYMVKAAGKGELPLFVRKGAILPINKPMDFINNEAPRDLEFHIYPDGDTQEEFYFDDGISFQYQKGVYSLVRVVLKDDMVEVVLEKDDYPLGDIEIIVHGSEGLMSAQKLMDNNKYKIL